jgi:hypothetical protein
LTKGGDGTFGRFHSEETKAKIRVKAIGRKSKAAKKIRQYSLDNEFIAEYNSVTEAADANNIHISTIWNHMNGKKSPKYIWKFI